MALRDPFAAYNAESDFEAHMICEVLMNAGIEAHVIEDVSAGGFWQLGTLAELHKPQVWIERADIERAGPILAEHDRHVAERRLVVDENTSALPPVDVVCSECGKQSTFPAVQRGSVQNCPHCRAYVDVGDEIGFEGWDEVPPDDESTS